MEFKWKGPFRFLPTGIFGITSGGGPLISVGIFRSKFAVPFLTNRFSALIREFGNDQKWQELTRFKRKLSFHFPWVVPLSLTGRFGIMESNHNFLVESDNNSESRFLEKFFRKYVFKVGTLIKKHTRTRYSQDCQIFVKLTCSCKFVVYLWNENET